MTTLSNFKRGDTFQLTCTYKVAGVATSLTGKTVDCQLRSPNGGLIADMTCTLDADQTTNPGKFVVTPVVADTSRWSVGNNEIDIQITSGSSVRSTETFTLPVVKDVTR